MEVKENKKQPKKPLIFYYVLALVVVMLLNVFCSLPVKQSSHRNYV